MANVFHQFKKGIVLIGETSDAADVIEGSLFVNSTDHRIRSYINGTVDELILKNATQTLSNKTFINPILGTPTSMVGTNITGTATGLTVGNATIAATATNAVNVGITNDIATNSAMYPVWVTADTGNLPLKTSNTGLVWYPGTATLMATTFGGALSGNASTASYANRAAVANNVATTTTTSASTFYPVLAPTNSTADQALDVSSLSYVPSTGNLTATTFTGALSGNASTATSATNISGGLGGQISYQSAAGITSLLSNGISGQLLSSQGTTLAPQWISALANPMTTGGDIIYGGSSGAVTRLVNGTAGQVLTSAGTTVAPAWGQAIPSGVYFPFAGASIPAGYLACDGSAISRTVYAALFSAISTIYGVGNGSTTFNIPDLRGRVPAGLDTNNGGGFAYRLATLGSGVDSTTLGANGGVETVTLTSDQLAQHSHSASDSGHQHANGVWTGTGSDIVMNVSLTTAARNPGVLTGVGYANIVVVATTGNNAHQNTQPTLVANYIIKI